VDESEGEKEGEGYPTNGGGCGTLTTTTRERGREMAQWEMQGGFCPQCGQMITAAQFINGTHTHEKEGE